MEKRSRAGGMGLISLLDPVSIFDGRVAKVAGFGAGVSVRGQGLVING